MAIAPGCGFLRPDVAAPVVPVPPRDRFADLVRVPGESVTVAESPVVTPRPDPMATPPTPAAATQPDEPKILPPIPVAPPDPPVLAALRAHLDGQPDAADKLHPLDPTSRELLQQLLPVVAKAGRGGVAGLGPTESGILAGRLESAAAALARKGPLVVEKAVFCRQVRSFGQYDPLPVGIALQPGRLVELYVELRNVPSVPAPHPAGGDGYVTSLVFQSQVCDAGGTVIEQIDHDGRPAPRILDAKPYYTRSPVRDYNKVIWFNAPARPGRYSVNVDVRDPASGRAVSRTLPFHVADP